MNSIASPAGADAPNMNVFQTPPMLRQQWSVLVRRRWIIIGIVSLALLAGVVVTMFMTKQYVSSVTLEISRKGEQVVKVDNLEPPSSFDDREFYQTQYTLLGARSLAENVARRFRLADDRAFFETFGVDSTSSNFLEDAANGSAAQKRQKRFDAVIKILGDHLVIDPVRNSRLVRVGFVSPDPALSQKIANAWADAFIESQLARRYSAASYARSFLEGRLEQLRQRLEASEKAAVDFAVSNKIVNIGTVETGGESSSRVERSLESDDIVALNNALAQAKADRAGAAARLSSNSIDHGDAGNLLGTLRQRRADVATEYAKLSVRFEAGYPSVKAAARQLQVLDSEIAAEKNRLHQKLVADLNEAVNREATLTAKVDGLKDSLLQAKSKSIAYGIYQRDADTNRQVYDALLQRYKEIGVASGVGLSNVVIVDSADLPKEPSSPKLFLNLALAGAAGLVAAALVVVALEQIDEQIKDPGDVERLTQQPLLGVIPLSDRDPLVELADPRSYITEAYLSLQALLQVSTSLGVPRSLAVTSTRKGEGKSTTAYAVSHLLAKGGRRVVLVDADMRSPSVHKLIGIENRSGTSNYLSGDHDISRMLVRTEGHAVDVLTAGPTPPNAAELLIGPAMENLVTELLRHYEYVVVDAPPSIGMADAPLIGHSVQSVLFAMEAAGARANMIRLALQRMVGGGANLLGVIMTKFDASKSGYGSDYGYGYGYGYDYGRKSAGLSA